MPIIDTNLLIRLEASDPVAQDVAQRLADQTVVVPAQVAFEFLLGAADLDAQAFALNASYPVEMPNFTIAMAAARLGQLAIAKGFRERRGDLWIAAHALVRDDYVVTTNKRHFTQLGVKAWNYESEPEPPC